MKALVERKRFFHWELEFPDVFTEAGSGFDVMVGNPPWEIQKPSSKEFFSNHDPLYRAYGKQEALEIQQALFKAHPEIEAQWLAYRGDFKDRGNFVRYAAEPFGDVEDENGKPEIGLVPRKVDVTKRLHQKWSGERRKRSGLSDPAHPFRHQGSADLNSYKMFVETGHALLRAGGQLGMVVPSGLYTDKGTGELRKLLLNGCQWRWLYGFENRNRLFDIDSRFKFCITIAEKGGSTEAIQAAFMRHDLEDWSTAKGALAYPAERVTAFSPKSLSVLEIRSEKDLAMLTKIYTNGVFLGDDGPSGWGIRYATEFHMTSKSKLFKQRDKAEAEGFCPDIYGRWVNESGEVLLPLYEGRMIGQFDFSEKGWMSGKGRSAVWREIPLEDKRVEPQFLMRREDAHSDRAPLPFKTVIMNIGSATNRRSMFSAAVPDWPANHSLAVLAPTDPAASIDLSGALNSFTYDWVLRNRLGGLNISWFVLEETPLPGSRTGLDIAAALASSGLPMAAASRLAAPLRPAITSHERLRLRCMLDAIVAVLYGLDRNDFAWILKDCDHPKACLADKAFCRRLDPKGFWRVDKDQDPELRHTVLSLAAFDDLQASIAAAADRDAGIQAFCDQNEGDGWMLPETLCLADLGLTRTVDAGEYDERARSPQPVRSRLGERFLDWQLAQTPEESWAECERHAKAILEGMPAPPVAEPAKESDKPASPQGRLPGMEH